MPIFALTAYNTFVGWCMLGFLGNMVNMGCIMLGPGPLFYLTCGTSWGYCHSQMTLLRYSAGSRETYWGNSVRSNALTAFGGFATGGAWAVAWTFEWVTAPMTLTFIAIFSCFLYGYYGWSTCQKNNLPKSAVSYMWRCICGNFAFFWPQLIMQLLFIG